MLHFPVSKFLKQKWWVSYYRPSLRIHDWLVSPLITKKVMLLFALIKLDWVTFLTCCRLGDTVGLFSVRHVGLLQVNEQRCLLVLWKWWFAVVSQRTLLASPPVDPVWHWGPWLYPPSPGVRWPAGVLMERESWLKAWLNIHADHIPEAKF